MVEWLSYSSNVLGFKIDYPSTWIADDTSGFGVLVITQKDALKNKEITFSGPVVNLLSQNAHQLTLEDYTREQVTRLRQLTGHPIKVDQNAMLGKHVAHKAMATLENQYGPLFSFFIWTVVKSQAYTFSFHCLSDSFKDYKSIVKSMVKSFSVLEIKPSVLDFVPRVDKREGYLIRIPSSWVPASGQGTICASDRLMSYGTNEGDFSVVIERISSMGIEEYAKKVVERLDSSRMEVKVVNFENDPHRRQLLIWSYSRMDMWCHRRLLLIPDGSNKLISVFCCEDQKQVDDETEGAVADIVINSFHLLPKSSFDNALTYMGCVPSMKVLREWNSIYKLDLRVGFYFDPRRYCVKLDSVPMTDVSFYLAGTDEVNSDVTFSVFFRAHLDKVRSFESITNEVMNNLNALSDNSISVVSREDSSVDDMRAHTLVCEGMASMFQVPERLYFVYKIVINDSYGFSVLIAFMARPEKWKSEWDAVNAYVNTLHRVPS